MLVAYPWAVVGTAAIVMLAVLVAVAVSAGQVVQQTQWEDWEWKDDHAARSRDAWRVARRTFPRTRAINDTEADPERNTLGLTLMYSHAVDSTGPILTVAKLQAMCLVENAVLEHPRYPDVCLLDGETLECVEQRASFAGLFYGHQKYRAGKGYLGRPCKYWLPPVGRSPLHCAVWHRSLWGRLPGNSTLA